MSKLISLFLEGKSQKILCNYNVSTTLADTFNGVFVSLIFLPRLGVAFALEKKVSRLIATLKRAGQRSADISQNVKMRRANLPNGDRLHNNRLQSVYASQTSADRHSLTVLRRLKSY
ncbi:MAG: hypothetical protein F6J95_009260 [Leptolyngbya sp. SIO1E4]|nr:hypothetical protein [Leptolyngbya sp. SIO1E4]